MALETLHIIALKRVTYSDRHAILTAWSRERGRVSLLVPDGSGRGAARNRALTMPASLAEVVADVRPGRDIWPARSIRPTSPLTNLRANPLKSLISQLLAEILGDMLRQAGPDERMFDFIDISLNTLDALTDATATANFHLAFLSHLLRFAGIKPDMSTYAPGRCFDMRDGVFRATLPPHPDILSGDEALGAARLARMTYGNSHRFHYTKKERNRALDLLLRYMTLHHTSTATPKSLEIIRSLF